MARRPIVTVEIDNLAPLARGLRESPQNAREAARRAVNLAAERARTLGKREIQKQSALTPTYLDAKLKVSKKATLSDLSADVTGRGRATSLARFATNRGDAGKQRKLAKVRVKPNRAPKTIKRSFLVRLRAGKEDLTNTGLAIRVSRGQAAVLQRRKGVDGLVKFGKPTRRSQAFLFYGPSVDQLFDKTRDDIAPAVGRALELEALRQLRVLGVTRG